MEVCSIDGNADLYGLGIRLGIYFQIISTIIVNHFVPDEVSGIWTTNGIFLLAVFAAVANTTVHHSIQYIEAFVMLQLIFAFLLVSGITNSSIKWTIRGTFAILKEKDEGLLKKNFSASTVGHRWRSGLALAVACFNVWFWFRFDVPTCEVHIFLFAKASPMPVAQQIYRIWSVLYLSWKGKTILPYVAIAAGKVSLFPFNHLRPDQSSQEPRQEMSSGEFINFDAFFTKLLRFYYVQGKKDTTVPRLQKHQ